MKRIFMIFMTSVLLMTGCRDQNLWDQYEDLKDRIEDLEALCEKMNSNISSLKAIMDAVQKNETILETSIIEENGMVIGYVIKFSDGEEIRIMNGKNGKDGEDGESIEKIVIPQVGVKQDVDGEYYWTINGEWILNEYGNKIKVIGSDGKDGVDGKPGEDGENGKDGITPRLKIEEGIWYFSLDEGQTWEEIGPAKGEDGVDGTDGNGVFKKIDVSNPDFVVFVLADGTEIKLPTWDAFMDLQTLCMQMNENLESLKTIVDALQEKDFVESISPLYEDSRQVGYTIVFSKKGSVNIYNGRDGQSITTVEMPLISIAMDIDGVYYWTLDGNWILDENGNKIKAEGDAGDNGEDGKDGITPQLKIEEGYWMISYDQGKSWQKGDKAVGVPGEPGAPAVPFFKEVRKDEKNMYIELFDGNVLTLPLASGYLFNKMNSLSYVPKYADGAALMIKNAAGDQSEAEFDFLVSPAEVVKDIAGSWKSMLKMKALVRSDAGLSMLDLPVTAFESDAVSGTFTMTVSGEGLDPAFFAGTQRVTVVMALSDGQNSVQSEEIALVSSLENPEKNQIRILYTTVDNQKLVPAKGSSSAFWKSVISNEYDAEVSKGVLVVPLSGRLSESAFKGISNLKTVEIEDRGILTEIAGGAFRKCAALVSVVLPENLQVIGNQAFGDCPLLAEVYCKAVTPPAIGTVFSGNAAGLKVFVPLEAVESYQSNYWWSDLSAVIEGYDFSALN